VMILSAVPGMSATTVTISPSSTLAFGTVPLGSSQIQQFTIKNLGRDAVTNVAVSETGQFFALTSSCPASLAAGAQCTAKITFTPRKLGIEQGLLTVTYRDGRLSSKQRVNLTGIGVKTVATSAPPTPTSTPTSTPTTTISPTLTPTSTPTA